MTKTTSILLAAAVSAALATAVAYADPTDPGPLTPGQSTSASSYMTSPGAKASVSDNSRLAALIPDGMSSEQACNGFRSIELCAATLHAAQNLNISFSDLKRKVGQGEGLSAAIHTLKPEADARAEERRAQDQAMADFSRG